jgi:hypothetical protein
MEKMNADRISEALEIWVGPIPALGYDREAALIAKELMPIVRALEDDFASTNAANVADNLRDMHKLAFDDFKRKHPEISDQAVHGLAARYTYANR